MTSEFASRSFMIIRSSMIIFSMVVGMSISTNAETVKLMDEAATDGSFTVAQTNGMDRREDRRDTRQDCRQGSRGEFRWSRLGPPLGTLLAAFSQNTLIYNCSFLASSACRASARLTVTERRRREWPEALPPAIPRAY